MIAAAALTLLAGLATFLSITGGLSPPSRQGATAGKGRPLAGPAGSTHQNMLIALYRAEDGRDTVCPDCWCVQRWQPHWEAEVDVRRVADLDMLGESIERACVADPSRIVVIGLSGPADALPASDDQAREVALCLLDGAPDGAVDAPAHALTSPGCIASSIEYRIHTWNR